MLAITGTMTWIARGLITSLLLAAGACGNDGPDAPGAECAADYGIEGEGCNDGGCAKNALERAAYDHFVAFAMAQSGLSRDALFERLEFLDIGDYEDIIKLGYYLRWGEFRMYRSAWVLTYDVEAEEWGNLEFAMEPDTLALLGHGDPVVSIASVEAAIASCDPRIVPEWCYLGIGSDLESVYVDEVWEQDDPYACVRAQVNLMTGELTRCDPSACDDGE